MYRMFTAASYALLLAAFLLVSVSGPRSAGAHDITITDILGREVQVHHPANRVLLGFYFEDFYAIVGPGAYDRVVAISRPTWEGWRKTQWDTYVQVAPGIDDLVDIGDVESGTFNIEAAIAARLDVAILAAWQFSGLGSAVEKLAAAGIPIVVVDYNAQTIEKHTASTRIIGAVMGAEERAERLAQEYEAAVADVVARVAGDTAAGKVREKVYVELGNKGAGEYGNSYAGTMWAGVITLAGGENIAEGRIERWGPLNPEYVVASQPDVILIPGSDWVGNEKAVLIGFGFDAEMRRARLRPYLHRPGWSALPAVQSGRVFSVYHGGARTLYDYAFLQYIAKALHPEAFVDIDPQETLRRYYETYLPIRAEGSFMVQVE